MGVEDFSAWSDEKRAEVLAQTEKQEAAQHVEWIIQRKKMRELLKSAASKVTDEEWGAIQEAGEMRLDHERDEDWPNE